MDETLAAGLTKRFFKDCNEQNKAQLKHLLGLQRQFFSKRKRKNLLEKWDIEFAGKLFNPLAIGPKHNLELFTSYILPFEYNPVKQYEEPLLTPAYAHINCSASIERPYVHPTVDYVIGFHAIKRFFQRRSPSNNSANAAFKELYSFLPHVDEWATFYYILIISLKLNKFDDWTSLSLPIPTKDGLFLANALSDSSTFIHISTFVGTRQFTEKQRLFWKKSTSFLYLTRGGICRYFSANKELFGKLVQTKMSIFYIFLQRIWYYWISVVSEDCSTRINFIEHRIQQAFDIAVYDFLTEIGEELLKSPDLTVGLCQLEAIRHHQIRKS